MNNVRRKELDTILEIIASTRDRLELVMTDEEEYRDNIPENLQGSERYEKADETCNALQDALDQLDDVVLNIETAME